MTLDIEKWAKNRDYTIPSPLSSAKEIGGRHGHRPAGTSIRWPAMYRELRKKGYSKRKAAMISNGKWRRKHGLPPKSRGTVELAKQSTNRSASSRRLNTHPRGTLSQLIKDEPVMLNTDDFRFAGITKAGTSAGARKGWITRRRGGKSAWGPLASLGIDSVEIKRLDEKRQPKRSKKLHTKMQAERRKSKVNAYILDAMEWDAYGNGVSMDDYINSSASYGMSDTLTDVMGDERGNYTDYVRGNDDAVYAWEDFLKGKVMPLMKRLQWADPYADDRDLLDPYVSKKGTVLNPKDFPFAQSEILKAGTRAGAIKGKLDSIELT